MNKQRESIYSLRRELLEGQIHFTEEEMSTSRGYLLTLAEELADSTVDDLRARATPTPRNGISTR